MHPVKTFKIIYQFVRRIRTFLNLFYYLRMRGNILLWIYVCMNEVYCALPFNYIGNAINIRLRRLYFSTFQHRFKLKLMSLSLGIVPCHSLIRKKCTRISILQKLFWQWRFYVSFFWQLFFQIIYLILNFILFFADFLTKTMAQDTYISCIVWLHQFNWNCKKPEN